MNTQTCGLCKFFDPSIEIEIPRKGLCLRLPPIPFPLPKMVVSLRPTVGDQTCGEWKEKESG